MAEDTWSSMPHARDCRANTPKMTICGMTNGGCGYRPSSKDANASLTGCHRSKWMSRVISSRLTGECFVYRYHTSIIRIKSWDHEWAEYRLTFLRQYRNGQLLSTVDSEHIGAFSEAVSECRRDHVVGDFILCGGPARNRWFAKTVFDEIQKSQPGMACAAEGLWVSGWCDKLDDWANDLFSKGGNCGGWGTDLRSTPCDWGQPGKWGYRTHLFGDAFSVRCASRGGPSGRGRRATDRQGDMLFLSASVRLKRCWYLTAPTCRARKPRWTHQDNLPGSKRSTKPYRFTQGIEHNGALWSR